MIKWWTVEIQSATFYVLSNKLKLEAPDGPGSTLYSSRHTLVCKRVNERTNGTRRKKPKWSAKKVVDNLLLFSESTLSPY